MALRRVANPPNPYESAHREYLEEPPAVALEVFEETAASIISENDSPDIPFRYSANPYRGCQHACAYCYARPTHEYLGYGAGSDFESKIVAKVNAAELLDATLRKRTWQPASIAFSGVTDCYQPIESVYEITRRCMEVCLARRNPVGIVTKSYLVVRDAELLARLSAAAGCRVFVSIPLADDAVARKIEPGTPTPSRRFAAIARLHEAGVPTGVMVAPIIPGLSDRYIAEVLERAGAAGASRAAYVPLRLPGNVSTVFLSRLRAELPDCANRVAHHIRDMRGGKLNNSMFGERMQGRGAYWESIRQLFDRTSRRLGMQKGESDAPLSVYAPPPPADVARQSVQLPLFGQDSRDSRA